MIKELKFVEPKVGESHWRGTLVLTLGGRPVPVRGFRWFPDSSRVEPPKARWGGRAVDVVPMTEELGVQVQQLFEFALADPDDRVFADALREFDREPKSCAKLYPGLYRACFLDRNASWAREFAEVSTGRLWPNRMLKLVVDAVEAKTMPAEELMDNIESGVLSEADAAYVRELLRSSE